MSLRLFIIMLAILASSVSLSVLAQTSASAPANAANSTIYPKTNPKTNPMTNPIEQIIVIGERSFMAVRNQIIREEEVAYRLFNELNNNDDFDITCRMVKANSHISRRDCEPKFFTRARQGNAIMALADMREGIAASGEDATGFDVVQMQRGLSLLETDAELNANEKSRFELLNEEMFRIAMENPAYRDSLLRIHTLKTELVAKRAARFGKK